MEDADFISGLLGEALNEFSAIDGYATDQARIRALGRGLEHLTRALLMVREEFLQSAS